MASKTIIPFNKPFISNISEAYMLEAYRQSNHCGNKYWAKKVTQLMKNKYYFKEVFLTPSCTSALEMGALLIGIKPGDEVILPSYTFSSTATAIMQFGAKPIFCEVDPITMNIDVQKVETLINERTKLIIPIDYAGVSCSIKELKNVASKYSIPIMVDCAQSYGSKNNQNFFCGTQTELATFSFHETKNITCGEGGALVVNDQRLLERAYFLQEKGTDRKKVIDGISSKYKWVDQGSSYLLSDILAAILYGQLEQEEYIKEKRSSVTKIYSDIFRNNYNIQTINDSELEKYNHHAYFLILKDEATKNKFINFLRENFGIFAYIGYSPLHSSPMGAKLGYKKNDLAITQDYGNRILRLPLHVELGESDNLKNYLVESLEKTLKLIS